MKIFKKIALIVVASSVAFSDPITGAFGIKFGQDVNTLKSDPKSTITFNTNKKAKSVIPPVPNKFYKNVVVYYTPKTKKVYIITGITFTKNRHMCNENTTTVKNLIEKKYNIKMKKPMVSVSEEYGAVYNGVMVSTNCLLGYPQNKQLVVYIDNNLTEQAKKEAIEIQMETDAVRGL